MESVDFVGGVQLLAGGAKRNPGTSERDGVKKSYKITPGDKREKSQGFNKVPLSRNECRLVRYFPTIWGCSSEP